jgi:NhaP-type Na+/H+ or K+/H+ antiporter
VLHHDTLKFNEVGFFYFILPPIIFSAGYTLKHRRFLQNLDTIMILGIFGTMITMITLSIILTTANNYLFFESAKIRPSEVLVLVKSFPFLLNSI